VGAPFVDAGQDSSIRIEELPKVIMGRKGSRLTEQRLISFEAAPHVAASRTDNPCAYTFRWCCGSSIIIRNRLYMGITPLPFFRRPSRHLRGTGDPRPNSATPESRVGRSDGRRQKPSPKSTVTNPHRVEYLSPGILVA